MSTVKIVTDSMSDIPKEVRERLGIEIVPAKVMFGTEVFVDGVTLGADEFYEKLQAYAGLPTTSQPSPSDFIEVYERLLADDPNTAIISIHISSQLSGTLQSANLAHSLLEREVDIHTVDSRSASYGHGLLVVRAAEMAQAGKSTAEILAEIARLQEEAGVYFLVDALDYLQKGGRIGKAAALVGSILNIKPILSLEWDGTVTSVDKVRGSKKAMQRIVDLFKERFGSDPVAVTIAWTTGEEKAMELYELLNSQLTVQRMDSTVIGPVIGTHVGPGTSALFVYRV